MQYYSADGQHGNVGQPSVLFRVPFNLGSAAAGGSASDIAGYGDWSGATGDVMPPDDSISSDPGSGVGRLLLFDSGAYGQARVSVRLGACATIDCASTPVPVPLPVSFTATATSTGTGATLQVLQTSENGGQPVLGYDVRYAILPDSAAIDATAFSAWTPAGGLTAAAPGTMTAVQVGGLTPQTTYGVGISAHGVCGSSPPTFQIFTTPAIPYAKLSGCFIATAAFGSDLAPEVASLRALRDAATSGSALATAAVDLYYRSSPPLAAALAQSAVGRAVVRAALRSVSRR
jgi:hypothetical protein